MCLHCPRFKLTIIKSHICHTPSCPLTLTYRYSVCRPLQELVWHQTQEVAERMPCSVYFWCFRARFQKLFVFRIPELLYGLQHSDVANFGVDTLLTSGLGNAVFELRVSLCCLEKHSNMTTPIDTGSLMPAMPTSTVSAGRIVNIALTIIDHDSSAKMASR